MQAPNLTQTKKQQTQLTTIHMHRDERRGRQMSLYSTILYNGPAQFSLYVQNTENHLKKSTVQKYNICMKKQKDSFRFMV